MIFFKIGCYVLILTCLLHLVGHFREAIPADETEKQMLDLMTNYQVKVGSGAVTMMGIYKGFSLTFSLLFLWTGVFSLFLVKQLGDNVALMRKIAIINTGALAILTGISLYYFFFIPTTCIVLALIFFVLAVIRIK